jgi:hypothetical protein
MKRKTLYIRHTRIVICTSDMNNYINIVSQSAYFGPYIPILLFGIISFMAGALAFLFPETKDQKLPDTVKQAEFVGEV